VIPTGMDNSQTDIRTGAGAAASVGIAALREQVALALDRLAELDRQIARRNRQLAEQEQQLAELREEIILLRDEIRELKNLPKRPRMKPSGMASSKDEDADNSASGSSGPGRSGEAGKGRRKGRGPRHRVPCRGGHLPTRGLGVPGRQPACGAVAAGGGDGTRTVRSRRQGIGHLVVLPVPGDDTGARHKAENGYCTAIGNELFTHFRSSGSKSRLDFLEYLCAGEEVYTVNDAALDYMGKRKLPGTVIVRLASHGRRRFSDSDEWRAHLEALGIAGMKNPVKGATEGALWGTICDGGRIAGTVILSDDAGQFNVGDLHALCWIHAERNVRKLDGNNSYQHERVAPALDRMWKLYRSLARYRKRPNPRRKRVMETRFDQIFGMRTGYASLDRLLERVKANKDELLRVLDHPETPLRTNGIENDIRDHVTRRKISFGTRSEAGRAARDACTGEKKTCKKLGLSFWDYLRNRLGVAGAPDVPRLADLIRLRATT